MTINQGDVYWAHPDPHQLETVVPHPHVVIQSGVFGHNRILVCALTSNTKRINLPGNVLLEAGEANLPRQSVVEVAKVSALDISQLGDYIGTLSERRINQVLAGIQFLQRSFLRHR